ncbi:putative Short chain fatty acid transporter [Candidatus Sulfopaludibacter sp. SbA4]|nr:putative Short chain fatty acid transporter [Candidatus Sulfopaludibacter sp. SbA4]
MTPETRIGKWQRFPDLISRLVPDAITASVILTITMVAIALALKNPLTQVMDAYHQGLWMLLPFTMQMTLIIVLSAALAATPLFRRTIAGLARLPNSPKQIVALAFLTSGAAAYLYWGLGYALGPMIAIYFAAEAERRDIPVDFPFLLAVTYSSQALWQYGLSASGPLLVASKGHFLQDIIGVVPLSTTIWSPAAIIHELAYATASVVAACWLLPKTCRWISQYPESLALAKTVEPAAIDQRGLSFSQRLENHPIVSLSMGVLLSGWLVDHFFVKRLGHDINSLNVTLLLLTFLLYRTVKRFAKAVELSAGRSWAVIVLYHLYAGVAGLVQYTNVGDRVARMAASISTAATFPLITAIAGSVFACFIPSSGGQWTVQGFVTVKTAMGVGVSVQRGMLALGVGDHMGNFLTPFWYVVVAGIARVDFRIFFGYALVFAAIWFAIGVVVFTFAPC